MSSRYTDHRLAKFTNSRPAAGQPLPGAASIPPADHQLRHCASGDGRRQSFKIAGIQNLTAVGLGPFTVSQRNEVGNILRSILIVEYLNMLAAACTILPTYLGIPSDILLTCKGQRAVYTFFQEQMTSILICPPACGIKNAQLLARNHPLELLAIRAKNQTFICISLPVHGYFLVCWCIQHTYCLLHIPIQVLLLLISYKHTTQYYTNRMDRFLAPFSTAV